MRRIVDKVEKAVEDAVRSFRTAGFLRTAQRAFDRVIPFDILRVNHIVAVEASLAGVLKAWQGEPLSDRYRHRWSTGEDLDLLTCGGLSAEEVRDYLDAGARAVITTLDREIVGYSWYVPEVWMSEGWLRVTIAANEIWGGHAYTAPKHRGQRIQTEVRKFAYPRLIAEGYERVLGFVAVLNRSSLRAGLTSARKYVGRIFYIRLLGLVIYRIDRKWGAGFWNEAWPYDLSFDVFDREAPSRPPKAASSEDKGPHRARQP